MFAVKGKHKLRFFFSVSEIKQRNYLHSFKYSYLGFYNTVKAIECIITVIAKSHIFSHFKNTAREFLNDLRFHFT